MASSSATDLSAQDLLAGRVAIVTGGSRGIGREVCLHLAAHGASVVVCYQGNAAAADEVVGLINGKIGGDGNGPSSSSSSSAAASASASASAASAAPKAVAVRGDVSVEEDVKAMFDTAERIYGRGVHIVVHLAGILLSSYPALESMTLQEWERTLSVNATGTFLVLREAAQRIVPGGGGRIVTASSSMVRILKPGYGAYVASKAAVEALTKIAAKEMAGRGITANCIAPGPVATDMFFAGKDEATIESFKAAAPLARLGTPLDIARLVLFLVSDAGEWVNGQLIQANGGLGIQ